MAVTGSLHRHSCLSIQNKNILIDLWYKTIKYLTAARYNSQNCPCLHAEYHQGGLRVRAAGGRIQNTHVDTVSAGNARMPSGVMWHDGTLYGASTSANICISGMAHLQVSSGPWYEPMLATQSWSTQRKWATLRWWMAAHANEYEKWAALEIVWGPCWCREMQSLSYRH